MLTDSKVRTTLHVSIIYFHGFVMVKLNQPGALRAGRGGGGGLSCKNDEGAQWKF